MSEVWRLHREALGRAATVLILDRVNISNLTAGLSTAGGERRRGVAAALRSMIGDRRLWTGPGFAGGTVNGLTL